MWFYDSVVYQIYPIGFCGAAHENDGSQSSSILKVIEWTEHIKNVGANVVLFNPIFESDSHGYDTRDFSKIDGRLGTNNDFSSVCRALKNEGIRIVLDGVFNHVGRGFWAFQDVLKNRENSPYRYWFNIDFNSNSCYNDGFWYAGWEGHYELVELNLKHPDVKNYLFDCVHDWIKKFDIDGLRLDVAYSLDFDFMRELRTVCCSLKPDFALIGEVLFGDYNRIVNDSMLHSCTNYECYKGLFSSLNDKNLFEIAHSLHRQFGADEWCIYKGKHLMTFVDNHDVERIATILKDKQTLPLVYAVLMAMPGVPCIYYASEWGQEGRKEAGNDWGLRPCFDAPIVTPLTEEIAKLTALRKAHAPLCYGAYKNVVISNQHLLFCRELDGKCIYFAVNISCDAVNINHHELNGEFTELLTQESVELGGVLSLNPYEYKFFTRK